MSSSFVFLQAGPWADELARAGFHVEVIAAGRLRQVHKTLATVVRLARVLRRRRPDLIVNWLPKMHLYAAPAAMLVGMTRSPCLVAARISARADRSLRADVARDRDRMLIAGVRSGAGESCGRSRPTFVVMPGTSVPDAHSNGAPLRLPPDVPAVGLVGRLQPLKGQDRLLEAHALLRERGYDIHTVIVGGDAHELPGIRQLATGARRAASASMTLSR